VLVTQAAKGQGEVYLAALTSAKASPADRLAAGALARLAVEPGLASRVASISPLLARLPSALASGGPYRSSPGASLPGLTRLAMAARGDEAVSALFDGGRRAPLTLDDAGMDGERLRIGGKKAERLHRAELSDAFAHRGVDGVAVEVYRRDLPADYKPHPYRLAEQHARELAAAGIGPRVLGEDVVFSKGFGPLPMRMVSLREHVRGRSTYDMALSGWISPEDRAEIVRVLDVAVEAGYDVSRLSFGALVLGETALKGLRRAVIIDGAGLVVTEPRAWAEKAAKDWLERLEKLAVEKRDAARREAMMHR
jgi:hypothetical protein